MAGLLKHEKQIKEIIPEIHDLDSKSTELDARVTALEQGGGGGSTPFRIVTIGTNDGVTKPSYSNRFRVDLSDYDINLSNVRRIEYSLGTAEVPFEQSDNYQYYPIDFVHEALNIEIMSGDQHMVTPSMNDNTNCFAGVAYYDEDSQEWVYPEIGDRQIMFLPSINAIEIRGTVNLISITFYLVEEE